MKRSLTLVVAVALTSIVVAGGGDRFVHAASASLPTVQAYLQTNHAPLLTGVGFAKPKLGWVVGNGVILRTVDGGTHFTPQYHTSLTLQSIQVLNASDVVAWGGNRYVITTDGGRHWRTAVHPGSKATGNVPIASVHFVTPKLGYLLVGAYGSVASLYQTMDGGLRWKQIAIPPSTVCAAFSNVRDGWLVTTSTNTHIGGFYHTVDGGAHWVKTQTESATIYWYLAGATIYPTGAHEAYAQVVAQGGMSQSSYTIFHTINGTKWTPVLGISTAGSGPAPGVGKIKVATGPGYDAGPMAVIGRNDIKVMGGMEATGIGTVSLATSSDGGNKWTSYSPIPGANGYIALGSTMSFVNASDGWLLDEGIGSSVLLHTINGGASWQGVYPRPEQWPVMGVAFVSSQVGYGLGVVGNVNQVLKTMDGGRTWQRYAQLPVTHATPYVGSFYGQGIAVVGQRGMAVGGDGRLYQSRDGGKLWHLRSTPHAGGRVVSVYLTTGTRWEVINTPNGVYRSRNNGASWSVSTVGNAASGGGAWMQAINQVSNRVLQGGINQFGANDGWASFAGAHGSVAWLQAVNGEGFLKSNDSGHQWTAYKLSQNVPLMVGNISFLNENHGWLWTVDAKLFTTTDGGQHWMQIQ